MGGSASKVDDVTALPSRHKMADVLLWQRYDNNKMAAICYYVLHFNNTVSKVYDVTALPSRHKMADVLLWQRYDNNKMADMCYYGNVILHLQQYSHRLNLLYFLR